MLSIPKDKKFGFTILNNRMKSTFAKLVLFFTLLTSTGCKKFIEIDPPVTAVTFGSAYQSDATAISVITSIYTRLSNEQFGSALFNTISIVPAGLPSDEYSLWPTGTQQQLAYYRNNLSVISRYGTELWGYIYQYLYSCNAAIEGVEKSTTLSPFVKNQLLGEAKFMRAFFYFYLVNVYGDVPLVLSTEYEGTRLLSRSSTTLVYQQILKDLKDSKQLLSDNYLDGTLMASSERVRPTKNAASALLARVYLFTGAWVDAENEATLLISNPNYQLLTPNSVFLKNSKEAIWQLQPTFSGLNTNQARALLLPVSGPSTSFPFYMRDNLINSFEVNDARKTSWTASVTIPSGTYNYSYKYKISQVNSNITSPAGMSEYYMVLRLGEQYLIRAEARAMQAKFQQAIDDINAVRLQHGGLSTPITAPANQSAAISIILHERFVELFSEWGHRWFDLKRTGMIDSVMSVVTPLKGGTWSSYKQLFPIPQDELVKNPNLTQNVGY